MKLSPQEVPEWLFAGGQEHMSGESSACAWPWLCPCASATVHHRGESCAGWTLAILTLTLLIAASPAVTTACSCSLMRTDEMGRQRKRHRKF